MHETAPSNPFDDLGETPRSSCPFCGSEGICSHQVARFDSGVSTRLEEAMAGVRDEIWTLVESARRAVAPDSPRPLALRVLPGGGRFLARLEQAWRRLALHARNDGDLEGWLAVLEADTDADVGEWMAHCIWSLGDAPVVTNADDGVERWYCANSAELCRRLEAGLAGLPVAQGVVDPLRYAG